MISKFKYFLLLIMSAIFLLSGCSFNAQGPESLMNPPKPYGKYEGIQEALEKYVDNKSITLMSPVSPEENEDSTPFVLRNIDEDEEEETIVFYMLENDKEKIRIAFLDKIENIWRVIGSEEFEAMNVNRVNFCDINGDGVNEVLVAWEGVNQKYLTWFKLRDGKLSLGKEPIIYSYFKTIDMNKDGKTDIFTLSYSKNEKLDRQDNQARLYFYDDENNSFHMNSYTALNVNAIGYDIVREGKVDGQPLYSGSVDALYIDEFFLSSSNLITEFVYWDKKSNMLVNPMNTLINEEETEEPVENEKRPASYRGNISIRDFDKNTLTSSSAKYLFYEVPSMHFSQGVNYINWNHFNLNGELSPLYTTAVIAKDSYIFKLPDQWEGLASYEYDSQNRVCSFYLGDINDESKVPLLNILRTPENTWNEKRDSDFSGYHYFLKDGKDVIAVRIFSVVEDISIEYESLKQYIIQT